MPDASRIDSFVAKTAEGDSVTIHVYQEYINTRSRGGSSRIAGHKFLQTDAGDDVSRESKGHYTIIGSAAFNFVNVAVTTDAENAP